MLVLVRAVDSKGRLLCQSLQDDLLGSELTCDTLHLLHRLSHTFLLANEVRTFGGDVSTQLCAIEPFDCL